MILQKEDELVQGQRVQLQVNTALWACLGRAVNNKDGFPLHHDTPAINAGLFLGPSMRPLHMAWTAELGCAVSPMS